MVDVYIFSTSSFSTRCKAKINAFDIQVTLTLTFIIKQMMVVLVKKVWFRM